jgi:uncharacterized protein YecE (DUF72 family)
LPRLITHEGRLRRARTPLDEFFSDISGLGPKLGPLLVQLPPSLEFSRRVARTFFDLLRERHQGPVVCEPRHASWFTPVADGVLVDYRVGRVATDPSHVPGAELPGGWIGPAGDGAGAVIYYRLHGSPRKYWSRYPVERIDHWAAQLRGVSRRGKAWCIFDNTASGAAAENALEMIMRLR